MRLRLSSREIPFVQNHGGNTSKTVCLCICIYEINIISSKFFLSAMWPPFKLQRTAVSASAMKTNSAIIFAKGLLVVVSKRWFVFSGGTKFCYSLFTSVEPPSYLNFTSFLTSFLNLNLTSASSRISNHSLETTSSPAHENVGFPVN